MRSGSTGIFLAIVILASFAGGYALHVMIARDAADLLQQELDSQKSSLAKLQSEHATKEKELAAMATERTQLELDKNGVQSALEAITLQKAALEEQLATTKAELVALPATPEPPISAPDQQTPFKMQAGNPKGGGLANMLKDPHMKDMMRKQAEAMFDMMYGELMQQLNLPEDRAAELKQMMLDRNWALQEAGIAMISGDLSPEERAAKAEEIEHMQQEQDNKIADYLGPTGKQAYDYYNSTIEERQFLNQFSPQLTTPMDPQARDSIIRIMKEEKDNHPFTGKLDQDDITGSMDFLQNMSKESFEQHMKEEAELDQKIAQRVSPYFSTDDYKKFVIQQAQHRQMQQAGMQMAMSMFGDGDETEGK